MPEAAATEGDIPREGTGLFAGVPLKHSSVREYHATGIRTTTAPGDLFKRIFIGQTKGAGMLQTGPDGVVFFAVGNEAIGLLRVPSQVYPIFRQAVTSEPMALNLQTFCYPSSALLQFVTWIHRKGEWRETLGDIFDGDIQDFISELCAAKSWTLLILYRGS
jgi:hypothetical protein